MSYSMVLQIIGFLTYPFMCGFILSVGFAEVRAESGKQNAESRARSSTIWPRLLSFSPLSQNCEDDDEDEDEPQCPAVCPVETKQNYCDDGGEEEERSKGGGGGGDGADTAPKCSGFGKKLGCMYRGARFGLKEGALSGIFFGGGLGMYKYFDSVYLKGEKSEGGSSDDESTKNDNIIFVTAANGAIAMAVFCTLFCSTKAAIYCT